MWQGWQLARADQHGCRLGDHLHWRGEQGGVEVANPAQGPCIDDQVGQRVEIADGVTVAYFGSLDAQFFGLTVDALGAGALIVDGMIERPLAIQSDAHLPAHFPVEVLDAALAFGKLRMVTRLTCRLGKKQGTTKALSAIAVGVAELKRGMHAPALLPQPYSTIPPSPLVMAIPLLWMHAHAL